jgi:hypothetical protein
MHLSTIFVFTMGTLPTTLALPSTMQSRSQDTAQVPLEKPKETPYPPSTSLPQGACGAADFYYSRASTPYKAPNSFYWLYPSPKCQKADRTPSGAASVNRILVDEQAETACGVCTFYQSNDCTGNGDEFLPSDRTEAQEGVGSDGYGNNDFGYDSWMCT